VGSRFLFLELFCSALFISLNESRKARLGLSHVLSSKLYFRLFTTAIGKSFNLHLTIFSFLYICLHSKHALILDYLVQRCYTRTARAFAADSTIRHLDADGDEIPRPNEEHDPASLTDEVFRQADLRQGAHSCFLASSSYNSCLFRYSNQHPLWSH
jgi:hypothetical protein